MAKLQYLPDVLVLGFPASCLALALLFAKTAVFICALGTVGGVCAWILYRLPRWQAARLNLVDGKDKFNVENEARRTLATILGGAALLASLYFTAIQLREQREQANSQLRTQGELAGVDCRDRLSCVDVAEPQIKFQKFASPYRQIRALHAGALVNRNQDLCDVDRGETDDLADPFAFPQ